MLKVYVMVERNYFFFVKCGVIFFRQLCFDVTKKNFTIWSDLKANNRKLKLPIMSNRPSP